MSVKEEIIRKSIVEVKKRLKALNDILGINPISEICDLRSELSKRLKETDIKTRCADNSEFDAWIKRAAIKEKEMFALAKKQQGTKLYDRRFKLENELSELKTELWLIEKAKG